VKNSKEINDLEYIFRVKTQNVVSISKFGTIYGSYYKFLIFIALHALCETERIVFLFSASLQ